MLKWECRLIFFVPLGCIVICTYFDIYFPGSIEDLKDPTAISIFPD